MTDTHLDSFESALLAELRTHVAEQPARQPEPRRPRGRRVRRLAVGAVAAGLAASVVGVVGLGGHGGASPAYAVELDGDGDVVVTVHRLDDAAGLEEALRARGSTPTSATTPTAPTARPRSVSGRTASPSSVRATRRHLPRVPITEEQDSVSSGTLTGGADEEVVVRAARACPGDDPCGFDAPAELTQDGADWVLRIPAGSPLMDRHVDHRHGCGRAA